MREPSSEEDQSALHLIGYHTSRKELRDVYYSIYNLNRALGFPSCGEVKRVRANLGDPLFTSGNATKADTFAEAKIAPENKMDLVHPPAYEVACKMCATKSYKLLQACRMILTDLTAN